MTDDRAKILIVEDENIVAMDLRSSLQHLGYDALEPVRSGADALRAVEREHPDLVLMDIRIEGELDGVETAQRIKERERIPIIYLTAYSDRATLQRAKITEPFGYLLKPFDERELHVTIEMALFRNRAQREHEDFIKEQATRVALEREYRWSRFLSEATAQVSASLDVSQTLDAIVKSPVPDLGDWAAVHLKEGSEIRTVSIHHIEGKEAEISELLRADEKNPIGQAHLQVIRTGESMLIPPRGARAATRRKAVTGEPRFVAEREGARSLCVPLTARDQVLGALTLGFDGSDRTYTVADLVRALQLARRGANALENAHLHELAQSAIALRDEFVSVAAHELQTPIAALHLALHNLQRSSSRLGPKDLQEKFEMLMRQVGVLNQLVVRLLDVSRIDAGRLEIAFERADLAAIVTEVVDRFRDPAIRSDSMISLRAPGQLNGYWDRVRLEQVFTNLLSNAIKFGAGRPIEVTVTADESVATVLVRDNGIGMSRELLPNIFERFMRGVSARNYGGMGLGLYVTRQLVEAHGGQIEVRSEPGQGSEFTVRLPRAIRPPSDVPPNATVEAGSTS